MHLNYLLRGGGGGPGVFVDQSGGGVATTVLPVSV